MQLRYLTAFHFKQIQCFALKQIRVNGNKYGICHIFAQYLSAKYFLSSELGRLTLSVPVVLLNSPKLSPYFSWNKFERISLLILGSLLCLINF